MDNQLATVVFGLSSALIWGAGDFCGGLASRRASVVGVLIVAELSGLVLLILFGAGFGEPLPASTNIFWGVLAGLSGTIGLGALYRGLATRRASIVAPVSAVVSSILPAVFAALTIGLPDALQLVGFALALAAIVLASQSANESGNKSALQYAFLAGFGFGAFFILIDQAGGEGSTFYPLAIARAVSIPALFLVLATRGGALPARSVIPLVVLSGVLDATGNVFFLLASTVGRIDVATILSSLYPASTVILSRVILKEQISRVQQIGVVLALAAIVLIAL